jgi:predicted amidohydrolase YtcJ
MTRVCAEAARRGWRIGTHAVGDRALRTLLDVYEAVSATPWTRWPPIRTTWPS